MDRQSFHEILLYNDFSSFEELTIIVIYRPGLSAIGVDIWPVRHATNRSHRLVFESTASRHHAPSLIRLLLSQTLELSGVICKLSLVLSKPQTK
jgi:hypothetical protein